LEVPIASIAESAPAESGHMATPVAAVGHADLAIGDACPAMQWPSDHELLERLPVDDAQASDLLLLYSIDPARYRSDRFVDRSP